MNATAQSKTVFNGIGMKEDSLFKLILVEASSKRLILTQHFTDSALQLSEGWFQSYYSNNAVELEGNYLKGKQDGVWDKWDSSGNIIDSLLYDNGQIIMETYYKYFPDQTIQSISVNDFKKHTFLKTSYDENNHVIKIDTTGEDEDIVFAKVEVEAAFPGGPGAWTRYVTRQIQQNIDEFTESDFGTCLVKFIVDRNGHISSVQALTMAGSRLALLAVKAISSGPDWIPAQVNGRKVKAYRIQPLTLTNPGK